MQTPFELKRKLLQLEALYDIGRALNTLRPEEELLEELLHRAISVLDAERGLAFAFDEQLTIAHVLAVNLEIETPARILDEEPIRKLLVAREPVAAFVPEFLGVPGGGFAASPMLTGERLIGAIALLGKE